jgi:hypothetical protein
MANHLAATSELQMGMLDYYHDLAPKTFGKQDSVALASMLLAREFYRRPKRANSLETLGLVQVVYPKLASITSTPTKWPSHQTVESWRTYLKTLLDFFIRENSILNVFHNNNINHLFESILIKLSLKNIQHLKF